MKSETNTENTAGSDCQERLVGHYCPICTTMYHKRNRTNKTGYLGVKWRNREQKYHAYIRVHGRKEKLYCGSAATAEEAAMLYDAKSRELYGDGAVTNFPLHNH
jgi:hypothetical protein